MRIRSLHQRKGVTILELLIGTIFVVVGVLGITLAVSKAMQSGRSDHLHWLAVGIAASKIQSIKLLPLQTIALTAIGTTTDWFGAGAIANPTQGCACSTVDWSKITPIPAHNGAPSANFPYSEVITMNGVPFICKVCVNRLEMVTGTWTPYCPAPGGAVFPGTFFQNQYRVVRVQVSWTSPQGQPASTEAETLIGMQL